MLLVATEVSLELRQPLNVKPARLNVEPAATVTVSPAK
ncbi:unannotated protein [freshwater metagenome]|uniref:Unannotated protein n=1 Tax=freshwater metagenome TaxID=449393 RepID=A0A6J6VBE1_9ZZZZ